MNHDETNSPAGSTDAEVEARVVAWVAGEASPFEIAELEKLIRTRPELAIFKRRIEAVHGLLGEAARPEKEPLRLSSDRRAKLLQAMGVPADANTDTKTVQPVVLAAAAAQKNRQWIYIVGTAVAACAVFALTLSDLTRRQFGSSMSEVSAARAKTAPASRALPLELPAMRIDGVSVGAMAAAKERDAAMEVRLNVAEAAGKNDQPLGPNDSLRGSDVVVHGAGGRGDAAAFRQEAPALFYVKRASGAAGVDNTGLVGAAGGAPLNLEKSLQASQTMTLSSPMPASANNGRQPIPPATDTIVRLDPFTVNATSDVGFVAAGSLAGGRITTALKDTPVPLPANKPAEETVKLDAFSVAATPNRGFGFSGGLVGTQVMSDDQAKQQLVVTTNESAEKNRGFLSGLFGRNNVDDEKKAKAELAPTTTLKDIPVAYSVITKEFNDSFVAAGTMAGGRGGAEPSIQLPATVGGDPGAPPAGALTTQAAAAKTPATRVEIARLENELARRNSDDTQSSNRKEADAARPASPKPTTLDAERAGQRSLEISTAQEPISTFSLHVSDVSFRLAQAAFARGEAPDASRIRPEEFYNAFDYGDPTPAASDKIGCKIEQSAHPILQQRNLLRIAMKVPSTGRGSGTPLRLTVLLDTSGSMEREDRAASVRRAFEVLVSLLGPNDRITLIGFARQPRLMAEDLAGNEARSLLGLIARTPADGGTNLEEALALASQLAQRHQAAGAQNRVVLLTDGAANLGNANPATLAERVTVLRQHGIAFDACGVGLSGINDDVLEALTRQGDGRYYVLNSPEAADSGFARQLAGAFRPAAENVKLQVRFNPARVAHQRLIGFEQHRLATEDFRNDAVDAAELAADEAAVALYQIEVLPQGTGEVGEVFVRFRDPASGEMVERSWVINYEAGAPAFDRAPASLQLAGTAALLAEKLRHSTLGEQLKLGDFARVVDNVRQHYAAQPRVQEFVTMFGQARRMFRE